MSNKKIEIKKKSEPKKINIKFFKRTIFEDVPLMKEKNKAKISMDKFTIPTFENYENIIDTNYNVKQLKLICKEYNLQKTGNKTKLKYIIYNFLKYSHYSLKIQRLFRGYLIRYINFLKGPALINRKCTNENDFLIFQDLKTIEYDQFFSYKDNDGFIYGFNIKSLKNLIKENGKNIKLTNPYNRKIINQTIQNNITTIYNISKHVLKRNVKTKIKNNIDSLSINKKIELICIDLFSAIDSHGHITDYTWFNNLTKPGLLKFIKELRDVWNYRLNLPYELKLKICPYGKPFINLNMHQLPHNDINKIKTEILMVLKKLITMGVDIPSKSLGAYYVLGCLTLVSNNAAISLPWLYDTFRY